MEVDDAFNIRMTPDSKYRGGEKGRVDAGWWLQVEGIAVFRRLSP